MFLDLVVAAVIHHAQPQHASRSEHRQPLHAATTPVHAAAHAWANEPYSIRVANCESGGGPSDYNAHYDGDIRRVNPLGYSGKWQFSPTTWATVGGVGTPALASEDEQDYRAYLLWRRDGWGQWECARYV